MSQREKVYLVDEKDNVLGEKWRDEFEIQREEVAQVKWLTPGEYEEFSKRIQLASVYEELGFLD